MQIPVNESLKTCKNCDKGCLICQESKDNCRVCETDFFLIQSNFKCVEKCPIGYYADITQGLCQKCHFSCKSCQGGFPMNCLTCDPENGLSLKSGFCFREGCPIGSIMLENRSCLNLGQCIESANLSMPKIFNIELEPLIAKVNLKIKAICDDYKKAFGFSWDQKSTLFDKALISSDNSTLSIPRDEIQEGLVNLKVDVVYDNKFYLASFNQTAVLILNKVCVIKQIFFLK